MSKSKGRPQSYDDEQLKGILLKFALNHTGKINFLQLEKESGVKRHIWSRRMRGEIENLNKRELYVEGSKFERIPLPNVVDIINKHWGRKQEMINSFISFNEYIQDLWEKAILQENAVEREQKLVSEIEEMKREIKFLRENRDYYKKEYEKIAVESTYKHKRTQKGIENVINIDDKKKLSSTNWKGNFPELFK